MIAACHDDGEQDATDRQQLVTLSMTVCLQPETAMTDGTRAMGDPGTYEHFSFPRYLYVYAVGFTAAEVEAAGSGEIPLGGGRVYPLKVNDEDVNRATISDDRNAWTGYAMPVDPPQTLNDSVYGSTVNISIDVEAGVSLMRFYVAASRVPLKHDGHELGVKVGSDDQVMGTGNTEADVLNLCFDVDDDLRPHLQNLYSSPYNYKPAATYGGMYYYTVNDLAHQHDIRRLIYHVASKVDVKWNVDPAQQADCRITYVQARKLKKRNCLLFRQMENTWTTAGDGNDESDNYSQDLMAGDIGQQWYGRQYFYTIPFRRDNSASGGGTGDFDINLHLLKAPDTRDTDPAPTGRDILHRRDLSASAYDVFTPWVRLDLNVTGTLYSNE